MRVDDASAHEPFLGYDALDHTHQRNNFFLSYFSKQVKNQKETIL